MGDEEKGSSNVFVSDPVFGWRPGVLEKTEGDKAFVKVFNYPDEQTMTCDNGRAAKGKGEVVKVDLKKYAHGVLPLQNVDGQGNLLRFPDMVKLPYLHEAAILYNMKARHIEGKPYTRTGDIVIAVNPFQWITELYTEKQRMLYSNRIVWEEMQDDPRDGLEPHVYEVSSLAYKGLAFSQIDQSILVSGESGAGKTETVKIAMNHMASVQRGKVTEESGAGNELDPVVKRVVQSNPLLEAFGNSKTMRNNNSSRFGKYLQLQFDSSESKGNLQNRAACKCVLAGSKCDVYLLEKNRVVGHTPPERTYHIFYQLCAAPDAEKGKHWDKFVGKKNKDYKYVGECEPLKVDGMTDEEHYFNTTETLELIEVKGEKLKLLYQAIIIVMQCGNLTFGPKGGDPDKSEITSKTEVNDLSELLGVGGPELDAGFTERTMKTKTESYKVPLKPELAKNAADSFAKEVYGKLFLWLVKEINAATRAEENYKNGTMKDYEFGIIGLLDIFGFESFKVNRFEQLCINYANEKLQQKFTEDVFQAVQREYEAEGIALDEISYDDNTDVLDLIESRTGLLAMLNEECVRPKGSDQDFVQKALSSNKNSPCLIVNKMDRMSFGVHHYAGKVMYDADGFVARNQDTLPSDLEELAFKSTNEIVAAKFEEEKPPAAAKKSGRAAPRRQKSNLVAPTIWAKYKTQLQSLMTNLRKTSSRYIRCVKPNMAKVPLVMEHVSTVEQLRCAGVVAAVTLARSAFPNRLENDAVRFRYSTMWDKAAYPSTKTDSMPKPEQQKADAMAILTCALKEKEYKNKDGKLCKAFVCGHTKSYFRAGALEFLEANRAQGVDKQAVLIQSHVRKFLCRNKLGGMLNAKQAEEKAAREAKEAAEKEAREKAEREAAERDAKRTQQKNSVALAKDDIQTQIREVEQEMREKVSDAQDRKKYADEQIEELKDATSADARKAAMEPKRIAAQQTKKLEEQKKMIDFLKKENKKIRKEHDKVKEKFDVVKINNQKLIRANEEAGNEFEDKDESSQKVHMKNESLIEQLEKAKSDNKKLKEECMQRQDDYMTQAETRLEYQKTMARILNMIQDTSKEAQVVEDTVVIALECEAEAKSIMAALEAETDM